LAQQRLECWGGQLGLSLQIAPLAPLQLVSNASASHNGWQLRLPRQYPGSGSGSGSGEGVKETTVNPRCVHTAAFVSPRTTATVHTSSSSSKAMQPCPEAII
jgi:hypothetical protein